MVKTTIEIDDDTWRKFTVKVIENFGGRKKNEVLTNLIKEFNKNQK